MLSGEMLSGEMVIGEMVFGCGRSSVVDQVMLLHLASRCLQCVVWSVIDCSFDV
jgi:hypothetical protein